MDPDAEKRSKSKRDRARGAILFHFSPSLQQGNPGQTDQHCSFQI